MDYIMAREYSGIIMYMDNNPEKVIIWYTLV